VIVGQTGQQATRTLFSELAKHYRPFAVTVPVTPGSSQQALAGRLPFVAAMQEGPTGAAAYICRNFTCQAPVTTADALAAGL